MKTFFAWADRDEIFDPKIHSREDLDILELTIDHREGEVALATIVVAKAIVPEWCRRHVFISRGENLLFKGRLVGLPLEIRKDLIHFELTSEPLDAEAQLKRIGAELKQAPYWDPSFVNPKDWESPQEVLEARSALFSWDRTTGTVCVSDLFQGRETVELSHTIFADSLKVRLAETPLSHVEVNLSVEWVQQGEGQINITRQIGSAFVGGIINSLTPGCLEKTWPKEGQKLGKSGYWIEKSSLKEISPPRTGLLDIYPTVTPQIMSWDDRSQAPRAIRGKRTWMVGELVLGWRYRQKRREIVKFILKQHTQLEGRIRPLSRTLDLSLQQVVPPDAGTYFQTLRGRQALEHAIEISKAHLAASARCLEIDFMLPLDVCLKLSTDHSVRIRDSRIPGGQVVGKVIAYQFHQNGLKSYAWVRLAAAIGAKIKELPPSTLICYVEPDYGDCDSPQYYQTCSAIPYANYSHQRPTEGLINLMNLGVRDFLKEVFVSHEAEDQIQSLQKHQYPVRQTARSILKEFPTTISLELHSLKTSDVHEHIIKLDILNAWAAPSQVNLGGFNEI